MHIGERGAEGRRIDKGRTSMGRLDGGAAHAHQLPWPFSSPVTVSESFDKSSAQDRVQSKRKQRVFSYTATLSKIWWHVISKF
jgi:hypothetical protein